MSPSGRYWIRLVPWYIQRCAVLLHLWTDVIVYHLFYTCSLRLGRWHWSNHAIAVTLVKPCWPGEYESKRIEKYWSDMLFGLSMKICIFWCQILNLTNIYISICYVSFWVWYNTAGASMLKYCFRPCFVNKVMPTAMFIIVCPYQCWIKTKTDTIMTSLKIESHHILYTIGRNYNDDVSI